MIYILNNDELGTTKISKFYDRLQNHNSTFHDDTRFAVCGILAGINIPRFIGRRYSIGSCDDLDIQFEEKDFQEEFMEMGFYFYYNNNPVVSWPPLSIC